MPRTPDHGATVNLSLWSASLPLVWSTEDDNARLSGARRPWNGRPLTTPERLLILHRFRVTLKQTDSTGLAAQAAYECLSTLPGGAW